VILKESSILHTYPYTISGKKIYQLVEDEEEDWYLQVTDI
jgi:hypothetical protein